ncbi:hypothetical protein C8R31_107119 [Nitrosospira sp. Nsp2]|uniref:hypothetical protein n=1 Tax=Nitrosospira sp. Nsp2 TaxID=136548 RepID=UPI000D324D8D|nr:hypothetical protein [Nitrosospira sp. Nsp2]PTR14224.1 hypothetical protein C8R31_107119 [Nitrosospira sp. Nsp2]
MSKSLAIVFITATLAVSLPAAAHTEEYFDSIAAPNGGQMRMAGPYHLELVTKDNEIVLYVADHSDKKISSEGGVGKASIQVGKGKPKSSIKLEPAGGNMLKGTGDFTVTPETIIITFIKLPDQEAQSARFTPLKPKAKAAKKPQDKKPAGNHSGHDHHQMHH